MANINVRLNDSNISVTTNTLAAQRFMRSWVNRNYFDNGTESPASTWSDCFDFRGRTLTDFVAVRFKMNIDKAGGHNFMKKLVSSCIGDFSITINKARSAR